MVGRENSCSQAIDEGVADLVGALTETAFACALKETSGVSELTVRDQRDSIWWLAKRIGEEVDFTPSEDVRIDE